MQKTNQIEIAVCLAEDGALVPMNAGVAVEKLVSLGFSEDDAKDRVRAAVEALYPEIEDGLA